MYGKELTIGCGNVPVGVQGMVKTMCKGTWSFSATAIQTAALGITQHHQGALTLKHRPAAGDVVSMLQGGLTMYVAIADRVCNDGLSLQIAQQLRDIRWLVSHQAEQGPARLPQPEEFAETWRKNIQV